MRDLSRRRFGALVVLRDDPARRGYVICRCDCGREKSIKGTSLTKKKQPTRTCGCLQRKRAARTGSRTIAGNSAAQIAENLLHNTNFQVIEQKKPPRNNTSGIKGVSFDKSRRLWAAYINVHGKRVHLGRFSTLEQAQEARENAEKLYFSPLIEAKRRGNNGF